MMAAADSDLDMPVPAAAAAGPISTEIQFGLGMILPSKYSTRNGGSTYRSTSICYAAEAAARVNPEPAAARQQAGHRAGPGLSVVT